MRKRSGCGVALLSLLLTVSAAPVGAGAEPRPTPITLHLSPRRVEQRIDARGHDRLLLRATAASPPFRITLQFLDLTSGRSLGTARVRTDGKTVSAPTPLPVFRVRLWSSAARDFQLEMTLP
jgi:hypothetical protein